MDGSDFVKLAAAMRQAQKEYFRLAKIGSADQKKQALQKSKALESRFDEAILKQEKAQFQLF